MTEQQYLPAGRFSSWLRGIRNAFIKENGADVPCGKCNACCRSSYFIHIRPEETRTLARIPGKFLFAAPGLPRGNVLLGYDENGHCPMLIENSCSIYKYRPLTCRSYDCRIFPAAGIAAGDNDKVLINQHIQRWRFSYPAGRDRSQHSAVQAAAKFLTERADCFPAGNGPGDSIQLAILAIKVYYVFLKVKDVGGINGPVPADNEVVKAVLEAKQKFENRRDTLVHPPVKNNGAPAD